MSGALAKMVAAEPGSSFSADFGHLGTVGVQFGRLSGAAASPKHPR
jgi:2-keto-4-pentenoate hydratase